MIDRSYLKRRAVQEAQLAFHATNRRAAAAHEAMAAVYFRQLAVFAQTEEQQLRAARPPQF
jgi:hypothetical protein